MNKYDELLKKCRDMINIPQARNVSHDMNKFKELKISNNGAYSKTRENHPWNYQSVSGMTRDKHNTKSTMNCKLRDMVDVNNYILSQEDEAMQEISRCNSYESSNYKTTNRRETSIINENKGFSKLVYDQLLS